ncbi:hypothetical protein [Pontibacter sp. SGAir0037]|uniref:hypothetical protein n=1 Tax=Pontibacter sp. SGAir0037 TaxID=2571030 RepID=UPI0010CD58DC|nr:hypothetical protein [Pontibacter sp. SGAir0037]QCR22106.1 hypothetical protein C1N53_06965 [Pontibacter sp. SGAir0037]
MSNIFPLRSLNWPLFLFTWLCTGFAAGAYLLLVPLRAILTFIRENEYSSLTETAAVGTCIILLVITTFAISFYLVSLFSRSHSPLRYAAVLAPVALAGYALYLFLNPENIQSRSAGTDQVAPGFAIGAYPEEEKLEQLKAEGYTGVITLLHPLVVPFEPILLEQEREAAEEVGIELIEAPMLPWIGDNSASIQKLKALALHPKGKYYIHCYLGKDRVNMVKKILLASNQPLQNELEGSARTLQDIAAFERGPIIQITPAIYLIPLPTDDEYFGYLVAGEAGSIVSLLDPSVADDKPHIEKEAAVATQYNLPYYNLPLNEQSSQAEMRAVAREILTLPKPVVIHHFSTNYELSQKFEAVLREEVK